MICRTIIVMELSMKTKMQMVMDSLLATEIAMMQIIPYGLVQHVTMAMQQQPMI